MSLNRYTIIALFFLLGSMSCHTTKKQANNNITSTYEVLTQQYSISGEYNDIIVLTRNTSTNALTPNEFLEIVIFDKRNNNELLREQLKNGDLKWISDKEFEISYTPGNPEKNKSYFFHYNMDRKKHKYLTSAINK